MLLNPLANRYCRHTLLGMALSLTLWATTARAEVVAEISFQTAAANGSQATLDMDQHASTASGQLELRGNGSQVTEVKNEATGIGAPWDAKLRKGYLYVAGFADTTDRDKIGLVTSGPAAKTVDYLNAGKKASSFVSGTAYMVVSPRGDWSGHSRYTLMGTGLEIADGASMKLWVSKGNLMFDCVRRGAPRCRTRVKQQWDPTKWYFIAVSWESGEKPVLYVRELAADGPQASPQGVVGQIPEGFTDVVPAGGIYGSPFLRPLAIGAYYYDPGRGGGTIDGADANIAYFRMDNTYSSVPDIENVFGGLAN